MLAGFPRKSKIFLGGIARAFLRRITQDLKPRGLPRKDAAGGGLAGLP